MKQKLIGIFSLAVIVVLVFVSGDLKIYADLMRLRAATVSGPDATLLYSQDLGVPASADLANKQVQQAILKNVKDGYGKKWDLDTLEIQPSTIPPIPPERGTLRFQQFVTSPSTGQRVPVEGGGVSMVINKADASDDILLDAYVLGIVPKDPLITPAKARDVVAPPIYGEVSAPELVYHYSTETGTPVLPDTSKLDKKNLTANALAALGDDTVPSDTPTPTSDPLPSAEPLPNRNLELWKSSKLAYRIFVSEEIAPMIPGGDSQFTGGLRDDGLTKSGRSSCTADTDCVIFGNLCISGACMAPGESGAVCESAKNNHDCSTSSGLVCKSTSSTCELPLITSACSQDSDCNASDKQSSKYCGGDKICHAKASPSQNFNLTGNGLLGKYYCKYFLKLSRVDSMVNANYSTPPAQLNCENTITNWSIDWIGKIELPVPGTYTFYFDINSVGTLEIGEPNTPTYRYLDTNGKPPGEYSVSLYIPAASRFPISISATGRGGWPNIPLKAKLSWSGDTFPKQVIAQKYLYTLDALPPFITKQPQAATITAGEDSYMSVGYDATPPGTIKWQKDGVDLPKTNYLYNGLFYSISNAKLSDSGKYKAIISNGFGTESSGEAMLTVNPIPGGSGTGLVGYGFANSTTLEGAPKFKKSDEKVDFYWAPPYGGCEVMSVPPYFKCNKGIPSNFSARWFGQVYAPYDATYYFATSTSQGSRIWIDGKLTLDNWYIPNKRDLLKKTWESKYAVSKGIQLSKGKHDIRVEVWVAKEGTSEEGAAASLGWSYNGLPITTIPGAFLFPKDFTPRVPNSKVGDVIYVDALSGAIIEQFSTNID